MKNFILIAAAVAVSSYLIPGVSIAGGATLDGLINLSLVVVVLALVNTFIKPVLSLITLPVNIITLGLFSIVINALMIMLVDWSLAGFAVSSFLSAVLFAVVLSLVRGALESFAD